MINRPISTFATNGLYAVSRPSVGGTHVNGRWVPGTPTTFSVQGSVQPVGKRDAQQLLALPEARRIEISRKIYTETFLNLADVVIVDGEPWEVAHVERYEFRGSVHYKTFLARQATGPLPIPGLVNTIPEILAAEDPGQALADMIGWVKPTLMYAGDQASGSLELISGVDNLSDVGFPTKSNVDTILGATTTVTTRNTSDAMVAGSSSVADVGDESIAMLPIFLDTEIQNSNYSYAGKRDPINPNPGYEFRSTATGQMTWGVDNGSSSRGVIISVDHGTNKPQVVLCRNDQANNICGIYSREGSHELSHLPGSLANSANFAVGAQRFNAAGASFALIPIWIGTDAEGLDNSHRLAAAKTLGFE